MSTGGQIDDILRRLARLEAQSSHTSEQLSPNSIQINSNGNIAPIGVDLQAGTTITPPSQDRVRWLRQLDQKVVSDITAWDVSGIVQLQLQSYVFPPDTRADIILSTAGFIRLNSLDAVTAAAHAAGVTIVDNNQHSSFPQLSTPANKVYIDFTSTGLTWPGGTAETSLAFLHGQPTPTGALYLTNYVDSTSSTAAFTQVRSPALGGCTVDVQCTSGMPPIGTAYALYILAILTY